MTKSVNKLTLQKILWVFSHSKRGHWFFQSPRLRVFVSFTIWAKCPSSLRLTHLIWGDCAWRHINCSTWGKWRNYACDTSSCGSILITEIGADCCMTGLILLVTGDGVWWNSGEWWDWMMPSLWSWIWGDISWP